KSLHDSLATKWSIFNLNGESIYTIIAELYKNDENIDKRLLQEFVGVKEEFVTDNHKLIVKDNDWDKFANAIKYQNRFHTQNINLQLLNHFLKFTESIIKPEDFLLYRCRISNSEPIDISGMYAPPKEKASAGRLNSQWISHLYLGDDELACIQEVRAGFHDNVY
ncbi:TPA: RES domain-containing protein, partial [Staphylococcus pseudintermedius]|nr:RES domain-containing protein [Staphylococcus pseudintermedius]